MNRAIALLAIIILSILLVRLHEAHSFLPESMPAPVIVGIEGDVNSPGIYLLDGASATVNSAIVAAGGIRGASGGSVSEVCYPDGRGLRSGDMIQVVVQGRDGVSVQFGSLSAATRLTIGKRVDPNRLMVEDLMLVPGMRKVFAEYIVKRREGRLWRSVDELDEISGVGPKTVQKWKQYLEVEN